MLLFWRIKKSLLFLLSLTAFIFAPWTVIAQATGTTEALPNESIITDAETIRDYKVTAVLQPDRLLHIKEEIVYDFGTVNRHGIRRHIPEIYERNGKDYSLKYIVTKILRDGEPEQYEMARGKNHLSMQIGDPDVEITGKHAYTIEYETNKAINFFEDHAELYWNVTGNQWPVYIENASFELFSPAGGSTSTLRYRCFTGLGGSPTGSCTLSTKENSLVYTVDRIMHPGEGFTVLYAFPKGMISEMTEAEQIIEALKENWMMFAPILALIGMLYVWYTRGKDPDPETVIPRYEVPRDLEPLVLGGTLGDGIIPQRGITATIIAMARKGYLHIEYGEDKKLFGTKQTYTFIRKNKPPGSAPSWEKKLWNGLFKNGERERSTFQDLKKDEFYTDVQSANKDAEKELTALQIFDANPYFIRVLYIAGAVVAGIVVWLVGIEAPVGFGSGFATFLIIGVLGWFMPRRTKDGTSIVAEVKGFKWFISVTEEERLKFHNAPARTPEQFMEFLPAAIALGVEKEWAEQFKDLHIEPPDWAEGSVSSWTPMAFASAISDMSHASAASVYNAPSNSTAGGGGSGFSSGGGSSGGGFGGGGGGSW